MNKFWLCWCEGRGIPKKKHETLELAKEEAARLATKEGDTIAIMECVGYVRPAAVPTEWVPNINLFYVGLFNSPLDGGLHERNNVTVDTVS